MSRTGFIWILLACALYGALHSVLAANTVKSLVARRVGQGVYRRFYRLFFVLVGTVTALPLLALAGLLPDRRIYTIPMPWAAAALVFQAGAVLALLYAVMQTGALRFVGLRQLVEDSPTQSAPEPLILTGLYRWVRHPIYTASFILLWLTPVMTWNLLALDIGLSAYMLIGTFFEEKKLVAQFGMDYEEYRKRTPRLIPGIKII